MVNRNKLAADMAAKIMAEIDQEIFEDLMGIGWTMHAQIAPGVWRLVPHHEGHCAERRGFGFTSDLITPIPGEPDYRYAMVSSAIEDPKYGEDCLVYIVESNGKYQLHHNKEIWEVSKQWGSNLGSGDEVVYLLKVRYFTHNAKFLQPSFSRSYREQD